MQTDALEQYLDKYRRLCIFFYYLLICIFKTTSIKIKILKKDINVGTGKHSGNKI